MVDLFFVLSGFAIFYAYHDRLETARQVGQFVWLRFWRLYPMHFVTLVYFISIELAKPVAGLFLSVHHAAFSLGGWKAIIVNILLLQSFNLGPATFNGPSWSISAEFYVYLFFALISVALVKKSRILAASGVICATAGAVLAIYCPGMDWTVDNGWVRGLAGFFAGAMTCGAYLALNSRRASKFRLGLLALLSLAALIAFVGFKPVGAIYIIPLSAALILLTALSSPDGAIWFLTSRPMRWLGTISYSIYMVHAAIAFGLDHAAKSLLPGVIPAPVQLCLAAFNVVAVIGVANFTFLWIEAPFRAWSRNRAFIKG